MFQAVESPAGVSDLDTSLSDVDRNTLAHFFVLRLVTVRLRMKQNKQKQTFYTDRVKVSRIERSRCALLFISKFC